MTYEEEILTKLINSHEKKDPDNRNTRKASVSISSTFSEYHDSFSDAHVEIEAAIDHLISWGFVQGTQNHQGYYTKVSLLESSVEKVYSFLGRIPKTELWEIQKRILVTFASEKESITGRFSTAMLNRIGQRKDIEYGLSKDLKLLDDVLMALSKIEKLTDETFIRNFSEMVFHDSKRLQSILPSIVRILMDYGDGVGPKETILEQYNLISNPGYVYIKGDWEIQCQGQRIFTAIFRGGVAISSDALDKIDHISVRSGTIISVENLTTYHDTKEHQGAIIYLGGFLNTVRTNLLKKLYTFEPNAQYFHKGDLDPYGFLILENLKQKTGIPFMPLEMDLQTLRLCHKRGHFRPLDDADRKMISSPSLVAYQPILQYMLENNCKIEQECFEAMKLEQLVGLQ